MEKISTDIAPTCTRWEWWKDESVKIRGVSKDPNPSRTINRVQFLFLVYYSTT
jgi:hypothetical protein